MGAGRVLIHEGVAHRSVSPACLHDPLALYHAMHGVQREPLHVHPFLWVLLQLQTRTTQDRLEQDAPRLQEGTLEAVRRATRVLPVEKLNRSTAKTYLTATKKP